MKSMMSEEFRLCLSIWLALTLAWSSSFSEHTDVILVLWDAILSEPLTVSGDSGHCGTHVVFEL